MLLKGILERFENQIPTLSIFTIAVSRFKNAGQIKIFSIKSEYVGKFLVGIFVCKLYSPHFVWHQLPLYSIHYCHDLIH